MSKKHHADNGDTPLQIAIPHVNVSNVMDAAYLTVQNYPGGAASLAPRMGMNQNTLSHKVNLNVDTHHLNLRESVVLQAVSGDFSILHSMAAELGHVALPVPPIKYGDMRLHLAKVGAEVGDVFREVEKALKDDKVTKNERLRIHRQVAEAIAALTAVVCEL